MATKGEIIESIQQGIAKVDATFGSLSDQQLRTQVHDEEEGWTAKEILAHLAGRQAGYDRMLATAEHPEQPAGSGTAPTTPAGFNVNDWNSARVAERIDHSRDELLAEFRQVHEGLIERVRALPDDALNQTIQRGDRQIPLGDALRMGGGIHSINHAETVEQALKPS